MATTETPIENFLLLLCKQITGVKQDERSQQFRTIVEKIQKSSQVITDTNEIQLVERIRKRFNRLQLPNEAARFLELYRKLKDRTRIQNRGALLCFFESLALNCSDSKKINFSAGLLRSLSTSTPKTVPDLFKTPAPVVPQQSTLSSGFSSIFGRTDESTPTPKSHPPSYWRTPAAQQFHGKRQKTQSQVNQGDSIGATQHLSYASTTANETVSYKASGEPHYQPKNESSQNNKFQINELSLVRDLLFNLQGIDGKAVQFDLNSNAYTIVKKSNYSISFQDIVSKISECGWLYTKIRKYTDNRSSERSFGLIGQSFCAALNSELTEYYHLVAVLDSQVLQDISEIQMFASGVLTLRRLLLWSFEPLIRLKMLAALVDVCHGKKGGALATIVYLYSQHGDTTVKSLMEFVLMKIVQPIFSTIMRWVYEGELQDSFNEFFVASDPSIKDDKLWHEKYTLRKSMLPSFIPMEQAKKILLTGKSINFLHHVCHDETSVRDVEAVRLAETHQVETIFHQDENPAFGRMIETIYEETSTALINVLHKRYHFLAHLKAIRSYLLLGQGDFIRHLMDLLHDDLNKPADLLYLHNLSGVLETAVRATNAQFDDSEIISRLDVRLLGVSPGDVGWDVFSLEYHVDGPMETVLTTECMLIYLRIFNVLWRAKRMEYALSTVWKDQTALAKLLRGVPQLSETLHINQMICSQMVHFMQQMQYYINFEVLECSWEDLLVRIKEAKDLDHLVAAHQDFLNTVTSRCLLNEESEKIFAELRSIFNFIIRFQNLHSEFHQAVTEEMQLRDSYDKRCKNRKKKSSTMDKDDIDELKRRNSFIERVKKDTFLALTVLFSSYQSMVKEFLALLAEHKDPSLRFLSFRLDFNEHYRKKDCRLR